MFCAAAALALCMAISGCLPSGSSPLDEQREPHFLTGKSRVNGMDYEGAVEAFEKALEVNPRSASAHFELGLLCENNQQDFAAAIYHFDRFLKLRPDSEYAEIVKQRVIACKQELAKSVSLGPLSQSMQRDLERLSDENRDLRQKLEAWQTYYAAGGGRAAVMTNPPVTPTGQPLSVAPGGQSQIAAARASTRTAVPSAPAPKTAAPRPAKPVGTLGTYTIKSGDTPAAIARKYGVKLDALLAANPSLDAKHMRAGQTVTIPSP